MFEKVHMYLPSSTKAKVGQRFPNIDPAVVCQVAYSVKRSDLTR